MPNRNDGKQFEILVQDIELFLQRYYGQRKVKTKRRYRVKGKSSIKKREIDVALFIDLGNRTFFIAIECRDWNKKVGIDWIEQLITKKHNVNADRMVAVSRLGFTNDAQLLAGENGIELWTLSEYESLSEDKKWLSVSLKVFNPKVFATVTSLTYYPALPNPNYDFPKISGKDMNLLMQFNENNWFDNLQSKLLSIKEIVLKNDLHWDQLLGGSRPDGTTIVKKINHKLPRNQYKLKRKFPHDAMIMLDSILVCYEIQWEPKSTSPDRIIHYARSGEKPVIEMHEFDGKVVGLENKKIFVAQVADKEDDNN